MEYDIESSLKYIFRYTRTKIKNLPNAEWEVGRQELLLSSQIRILEEKKVVKENP